MAYKRLCCFASRANNPVGHDEGAEDAWEVAFDRPVASLGVGLLLDVQAGLCTPQLVVKGVGDAFEDGCGCLRGVEDED